MHRLFGPEHSLHTPTLQAGPQPPPGFSHPPGGRCAGWPPRGPVPCRPTLQAAPHPPCRPSRHCVAVRSAPPMAQSIQDPRLAFVVDYDTHPPSAVRNVLGGQCPMDRKKVHSFFVVMNLSVPMTESGEFQAKGLLARIRRCTIPKIVGTVPPPATPAPREGAADPQAGITRKYQLVYFLSDKTVEMYDIKNRRIFLKRCPYPSLDVNDFVLGPCPSPGGWAGWVVGLSHPWQVGHLGLWCSGTGTAEPNSNSHGRHKVCCWYQSLACCW